ncbi:MAG: hypothetical protein V8R91_08670 [Butyricimonas faecihominis]
MEYTLAEEEYVPESLFFTEVGIPNISGRIFEEIWAFKCVNGESSFWDLFYAESIINWDTWEVEYVLFPLCRGGELAMNYMAIAPVSKRFKEQNMDDLKRWWLSLFVEKGFVQLPYPARKYAKELVLKDTMVILVHLKMLVTKYAFVRHSRDIVLGNKIPIEQDFGDFVSLYIRNLQKKEKYYAKNSNIKIKSSL